MTMGPANHPTLQQWLNGIRIMHRSHIEASKATRLRHRVLGSVAAATGVISATAVFANLRENPKVWVQVVAGAIALLAVALTVIHTFLNYAGVSASHQSAATGYGGLRREVEQRLMTGDVDESFLTHVRTSWTRLDQESVMVPPRLYDRFSAEILGDKPPDSIPT